MSLIYRRHSDYSTRVGDWHLFEAAHTGGRKFINGGHLFQHSIEEVIGYSKRLQRAYYYNYCKPIVSIYNQFIFSAQVSRTIKDKKLKQFATNSTGDGKTIDGLISLVNKYSAVFGTVYVVVEPDESPIPIVGTAVIQQNIRAKILKPYTIIDWSIDKNGDFNWVKIKTEHSEDNDPNVERTSKPRYILWERHQWTILDETGAIVGEPQVNQLGVVPIVVVNHYEQPTNESIVGESLIEDIAVINRSLFNWCSLLDEILYEQTFSMLAVQTKKQDQSIQIIGAKRVFTYEAGTNVPVFISPDASQAKIFIEWINKSIREMYRLASLERSGMVYRSETAQSGDSKEFDLIDTNQAIAAKAQILAEAEIRIMALVHGWEKAKQVKKSSSNSIPKLIDDVKKLVAISYPKTFDVRGYQNELTTAFEILNNNISDTFAKEFRKYLASRALPNISPDKLAKIHDEIDTTKQTKNVQDNSSDGAPA